MADPGRFATLPANHHQIGEDHGGLLLHNAAFDIFLRIGTSMLTQHIDVFHHSPFTPRVKAQDLTPLSTVFPRQNQHLIIFLDVQHVAFVFSLLCLSFSFFFSLSSIFYA